MESLASDLWNAIKTFSPGAVGAAFAALPAAEKAKVMKAIVNQVRMPAIAGAISSAGNE